MVNEWIRLGRVKTLCPWALAYNESVGELRGSWRVAGDGGREGQQVEESRPSAPSS